MSGRIDDSPWPETMTRGVSARSCAWAAVCANAKAGKASAARAAFRVDFFIGLAPLSCLPFEMRLFDPICGKYAAQVVAIVATALPTLVPTGKSH